MITQVAASIVLVVGAGLLIRALVRVQSTPAGFDRDGVLTIRTFLPWTKYGPADPATLSIAAGVSLLLCIAGSLIPALRASRTNPRDAIQAE